MNLCGGFRIQPREYPVQVFDGPLICPAAEADAQLLRARRTLEETFEQCAQIESRTSDYDGQASTTVDIGDSFASSARKQFPVGSYRFLEREEGKYT